MVCTPGTGDLFGTWKKDIRGRCFSRESAGKGNASWPRPVWRWSDAAPRAPPWPPCWLVPGVGSIRIIDRDYVEPSNLQRQSLFDESDAAQSLPKAIAAARKIAAFNSQIVIEPQVADLIPANVESLLDGIHLILDGTDNFETRYLLNDFAVKTSLPWIYTAAVGSYGVTFERVAGKDRMSGVPVSRSSARSLRDL